MTSASLIISVVSLMAAVLAVFVARANLQRQIQVAAQEAWIREFREQVAVFLAANRRARERNASAPFSASPAEEERRRAEFDTAQAAQALAQQVILLLIAERGWQHKDFAEAMARFLEAAGDKASAQALTLAAMETLQRERAAIASAPGLWREVRTSLGIDAVGWRPWARLRAWLSRDPPRFPDLP